MNCSAILHLLVKLVMASVLPEACIMWSKIAQPHKIDNVGADQGGTRSLQGPQSAWQRGFGREDLAGGL